MHDPSHWAEGFKQLLINPEFHLSEHFRTNFVPLYWIMRINGDGLEAGAGTARGAILAKRLLPDLRVVALDIDPSVCKIAREYARRTSASIEIVQGDVFKLPFADNEFTVSFSSGLLEHYSDAENSMTLPAFSNSLNHSTFPIALSSPYSLFR